MKFSVKYFVVYTFGVIFKNPLLHPKSQRFTPFFLLRVLWFSPLCLDRSRGNSIIFWRDHCTVFHSDCTILHSCQQYTRVLVSLRPCQDLLFSFFFFFSVFFVVILFCLFLMRAILVDVKWQMKTFCLSWNQKTVQAENSYTLDRASGICTRVTSGVAG